MGQYNCLAFGLSLCTAFATHYYPLLMAALCTTAVGLSYFQLSPPHGPLFYSDHTGDFVENQTDMFLRFTEIFSKNVCSYLRAWSIFAVYAQSKLALEFL